MIGPYSFTQTFDITDELYARLKYEHDVDKLETEIENSIKYGEPNVEVVVNTYGGKIRVTIDVTPLFESAEMDIDMFIHSEDDDEFD